MAASIASPRAGYSVPMLISTAPAMAANCVASLSSTTMAGDAPNASSTFAVKVCTTSLVRQCTSGFASRNSANVVAAMWSGSS
jgi:hypothetical protein